MKKTIIFSLIVLFTIIGTNRSYGFSNPKPITNAVQHENEKALSISEFVKLSAKQFSELTGKKMNMWDKASFSIMKIKMKHDLKKNPNLTLKDYSGVVGKKRLGTGWWILIIIGGIFLIVSIGLIITGVVEKAYWIKVYK